MNKLYVPFIPRNIGLPSQFTPFLCRFHNLRFGCAKVRQH